MSGLAAATQSSLPLKRKALSPDAGIDASAESDDDLQSPVEDGSTSMTTAAKANRGGSELVPSTKPGEAPVTKRTLQNRKAQREFRKRREARVKDLEERCRRFDQMGLEANEELQRVARRFKDENEALRGLLIRLGYGGLIAQALEGLNSTNGSDAGGMYDSGHGGMYSGAAWSAAVPQQQAQQQQQPQVSMPPAPPGSINTNSLGDTSYGGNQGNVNAGMPASWPEANAADARNPNHVRSRTATNAAAIQPQRQSQQQQQQPGPWSDGNAIQSNKRGRSATSGEQRRVDDAVNSNPLLSLNLGGQDAQRAVDEDSNGFHGGKAGGAEQDAPGTLTPGTFNSLMGILGGGSTTESQQQQQPQQQSQSQMQPSPQQSQQPQSGGGSAFLRNAVHNNMGTPFATAHRPHQNDALLNPNPIPFALNLSNEPQPDQSWWDRNGGGMFGSDSFLDEKAHVVAQAQSQNRNGSQSPFDIGAFLTTGTTPGNNGQHFSSMPTGFTPALAGSQDNGDPLSRAGAELLSKDKHSSSQGFGSPRAPQQQQQQHVRTLNPADHVQTFLRLLERRAIRAGEQRRNQTQQQQQQHPPRSTPWMDMGSDVASDEDSSNGSNGSSSRSNSLDDVSGSDNVSIQQRRKDSADGKMITPNSAYSRLAQHPIFLNTDSSELEAMINTIQASRIATVTAQGSCSGAPLEVDANALDSMMDMLDRKQKTGEAIAGQNIAA